MEFVVTGMTCNNCARQVTDAVQTVSGVDSATVALSSGRLTVRWREPGQSEAILRAIQLAGFSAKPLQPGTTPAAAKPEWHLNLWLGGVITGALMIGNWGLGLGFNSTFQWLSLLAAGVVQVFCGAQFYRGAWRQLHVGSFNMDTLVALGSSTAYVYSVWALAAHPGGHVYFMEAAAIITLISLGHWLEGRVSSRASSALQSLLQLAPQTARRLVPPNKKSNSAFSLLKADFVSSPAAVEREVAIAELKIGDLVSLRPGDRIPVDGVVTDGAAAVNEAMLTGEATPVDKSVGNLLYAGTVNLNGRLNMRVTATGEATALAHIIAAVQRAQSSRANIQRLGDRISNVFVPVVLLAAVVAGLWWGLFPDSAQAVHDHLRTYLWGTHPPQGGAAGFIIAAAVLIVACPCAMGLATPAAIMAGANAAAARGILIRDGIALEKAGEISTVVFDKTGTFTKGSFEVAAFACLIATDTTPQGPDALAPDRVRAIAAALARHSTHPVSIAVAGQSDEAINFDTWREVSGAGVQGCFADVSSVKTAYLGSFRWLREMGVGLEAAADFEREWSLLGASVVGFALDQTLAGVFAIRDTLKPGARSVVVQLQQHGLKIYLLTGDTAATAQAIARELGIASDQVFAEVRPERKAELVEQLRSRGERVAFVGDGINDAPALKQADLGIAVSRASDVAREAADMILLKSEIEAVPEALGLARATLRTIKQNLFWAFFYNSLAVPLAALGFMSPVVCAAAMGFSDLIVIGNALRLRGWRL